MADMYGGRGGQHCGSAIANMYRSCDIFMIDDMRMLSDYCMIVGAG